MSKHTPAPWIIGDTMQVRNSFDGDTEITEITTLDGEFVACVNLPNDNHAENARLIAAAPELLAALQELLNALGPYDLPEQTEKARAVIAKVKGE